MALARIRARGDESAGKLLEMTRSSGGANLAFFQAVWRAHDRAAWSGNREIYQQVGEKILQLGEPLFAYDVLSEGLKDFPRDVALRQLLALALARSGAAEAANGVLAGLYREGRGDEETLGLLARTHKDLAAEAGSAADGKHHLRQAYRYYAEAYGKTGGYWTGINAATLAYLLGQTKRAARLAREVQAQCREQLEVRKAKLADRYWVLSTLGEAALVQGNWDEAERWYTQAVEAGGGDWGSLQSTRHNARLLIEHMGADASRIERLFRFPTVAVFSGHLLDRPERRAPRFPPELAGAVKAEIRRRVEQVNARFGYASAGCGADILFLEAMLETGGEVHVVLPYGREVFSRKSVNFHGRGRWVHRFEKVLARAAEVQELPGRDEENDGAAFEFANRILLGLARLRAEHLETRLLPMAVWDGKPGDGPGGTADNVGRWRKLGLGVEVIDLEALLHRNGRYTTNGRKARHTTHKARRRPDFAPEIRALLFADFEGFSRLSDAEVPRFVSHCLGLVGKLACVSCHRPVMKNTWGDGLFLVFSSVREAGEFALELRDAVRRTGWREKGLPEMKVRIGLHAGPVFCCKDPVTGRSSYIGAHVSRAARIEPITPTGQVYASQAFAALAAAEGVREFRCDYVGQTSLAKKYGTFPTYVVLRRSGEARGR
jgi:class 3 adenylate cyclase